MGGLVLNNFSKEMEMILYHSDDGDVSVNAYIKDETLWITQKAMAELFDVQVPVKRIIGPRHRNFSTN